MVEQNSIFQSALKEHGYSITQPRLAVFKALRNREPQTLRSILSSCGGSVDRASVYRTILLFEKLGIIKRLQIGWKYKLELSDSFGQHHHHLSCSMCDAVIPIAEDGILEDRLNKFAQQYGFIAKDHQLEISGICQNCQRGSTI